MYYEHSENITDEFPGAAEAGLVVKLVQDIDQASPRDCDMLTTFWTRDRNLVNEHKPDYGDALYGIDSDDFGSVDEWVEAVEKAVPGIIVRKVYMYSHSGDTISLTPFGCRWDSGVAGLVYITPEHIRDVYMVKRITAKVRTQAEAGMVAEVEEYARYIEGDVWGYTVEQTDPNATDDGEPEEIGSCWGFYGTSYIRDEVKYVVESGIESAAKNRAAWKEEEDSASEYARIAA